MSPIELYALLQELLNGGELAHKGRVILYSDAECNDAHELIAYDISPKGDLLLMPQHGTAAGFDEDF